MNKKVIATAIGLALTMAASSVAFAAIASDSELSTLKTLEQQVRDKVTAIGKDNLTDTQKSALSGTFGGKGGGHRGGMRGGAALTDEQKAAMETNRAEREAKVAAFKATLSAEQLAAYEQAFGSVDGTDKPQADREQMKAGREARQAQRTAFEATLTSEQKTAYDELFAKKERPQMTDEQKAQMDANKAERQANEAAFTASLTSEQAAQYAALQPTKTAERGKHTEMTDAQKQEFMAQREAQQAQLTAFVATLAAEQQALYEKACPGMTSEAVQSRIQSLQTALDALN